MIIGAALICGAVYVFINLENEDIQAGETARQAVQQIEQQIEYVEITEPDDPYNMEMSESMIDGYSYIGIVTIPDLQLKLPVMADHDDYRLKLSPCRFDGSTKSDDLIIMAHNYKRHFASLKTLSVGRQIFFTDMDGVTIEYEISEFETLMPDETERLLDGRWDLTLFTCTYGGASRTTVRCVRVENQ